MRKHWLYLKYVLRHKWFVFEECLKYGLVWQGIIHDWSKFLPDEWFPYVEKFYGGPHIKLIDVNPLMQEYPWIYEEKVKEEFDVAWNLHLHRSPHHWQFWLLKYDDGNLIPLPMPDKYRKEMIADWRGAGKAQGNPDTKAWYLQRREGIPLHPDTKIWVEQELGIVREAA